MASLNNWVTQALLPLFPKSTHRWHMCGRESALSCVGPCGHLTHKALLQDVVPETNSRHRFRFSRLLTRSCFSARIGTVLQTRTFAFRPASCAIRNYWIAWKHNPHIECILHTDSGQADVLHTSWCWPCQLRALTHSDQRCPQICPPDPYHTQSLHKARHGETQKFKIRHVQSHVVDANCKCTGAYPRLSSRSSFCKLSSD
jgi:hypothetical protein